MTIADTTTSATAIGHTGSFWELLLCFFKGHKHEFGKSDYNETTRQMDVPDCSRCGRCGSKFVSRIPKMDNPIPTKRHG